MGTNMNFKNYGSEPPSANGVGRPPEDFPLSRQQSIYSLTFDEFQSTVGGSGKDFGSMNMDELLKNIWSAEETQTMGSTNCGQESVAPGGYLQRQGSLTLPRTLSQKTVDEVWRDIATGGGGDSNLPQRQQTLKEITLEEFLVRAGVVREEIQLPGKTSNSGFFGNLSRPGNDSALGFGFQQIGQHTGLSNSNQIQTPIQSANLPVNVNGVRSTQQPMYIPQPQQQQQQQPPPSIFPKQLNLAYANPIPISNGSPGIRSGIVGNMDSPMNGNLVQGGGMGMIGLGTGGAVTVATVSPVMPSDGRGKSNGNLSSVSPVPYVFNGGLRGRKSGNAVEKVVERRQRRMIKNRESAARSRARKQAYTTELEEEVAKLKEENQELRTRQACGNNGDAEKSGTLWMCLFVKDDYHLTA
ncbi:abscisic acid responsive elements-binding factor 2 [Actinidia rufa]|uniref:Abscisic acid responsive elements-binding factor 2 n=1 Tax=Actinidia rufa TaxID=165716 RepID=A0A7J0EK72_9ERIC|nr:abscisic acid responsive elements-binding factor 2 [Actinidia rufa]